MANKTLDDHYGDRRMPPSVMEGIMALLGGAKDLGGDALSATRDASVTGIRGIMDLLGLRPEGTSSMGTMANNMDTQIDRIQKGTQDNTPIFDYLDELLLPDVARARRHGTKAAALGASGAFDEQGNYIPHMPVKRRTARDRYFDDTR